MLHTLNHPQVGPAFGALLAGEIGPGHLPEALTLLDQADARGHAEAAAERHHREGMNALDEALVGTASSSRLRAIAEWLLGRSA
jgi:hypothetical protein